MPASLAPAPRPSAPPASGPVVSAAPESMSGPAAPTAPAPTAERRRCLVVDDHPAVRLGLSSLLAAEPGLRVVATCATAEEALGFAEDHRVDVAIVDHQLGGRSGLWLSRRLAALPAPPRVVVYSAFCNHLLAAACVVAQADALVSKAALGEVLVRRVREAADGDARLPPVPPALTTSLGRRFDVRQQSIFGLMAAGVPPSEVAATLRISEDDVDNDLWRMLDALGRPTTGRAA